MEVTPSNNFFSAKRRSVNFTNEQQIIIIPSRDTFTAEEIRAAHYSKNDFKEMRWAAAETIRLHHQSSIAASGGGAWLREEENHNHILCMRGLEGRTTEGFRTVKNNRAKAAFAVIDESDRQDEMGIIDHDLISEVYQKSSLPSRCLAFARGVLDAQEVIRDNEDKSSFSSPSFGSCSSSSSSSSSSCRQTAQDPTMFLQRVLDIVMEDTTMTTSVKSGGFQQLHHDHTLEDSEVVNDTTSMMDWTAEAA